jgi:hypothetical protein
MPIHYVFARQPTKLESAQAARAHIRVEGTLELTEASARQLLPVLVVSFGGRAPVVASSHDPRRMAEVWRALRNR